MLCKNCALENILYRGINKCHSVSCVNLKNEYYEFCKECANKTNRCECCGNKLLEGGIICK